jgi:hypothetical protein
MVTRSFSESYLSTEVQNFDSLKTANQTITTVTGSRTGSKVPDWREKIRRGNDASSAFQSDRSRIEGLRPAELSMTAMIRGTNQRSVQYFSGLNSSIPSSLNHLLPDQASAEAAALTSLYKKINANLSHLSGASSLAEFGDVLHQFGHPFKSIVDLTNRRLNKLELMARGLGGTTVFRKKKWGEIVASTWLEYAFGLAPLISDTKKAAEALARWQFERSVDFKRRAKVVGRGQSTKAEAPVFSLLALSQNWGKTRHVTRTTTERKVQYIAGLGSSLEADFGSSDRLLQLLGFKPSDWIPAAWEVIPWSWLADYFANVNNILDAVATSTADVKWVCKTVTDETIREVLVYPDPVEVTKSVEVQHAPWRVSSLSASEGGYRFVRKTVTRTPNVQLGVPPLIFSLPDRWGQFANMAAVLMSRQPKASALWIS